MTIKTMQSKLVGKGKGARLVPFPSSKFDVVTLSVNPKTKEATIEYVKKGA